MGAAGILELYRGTILSLSFFSRIFEPDRNMECHKLEKGRVDLLRNGHALWGM